MSLYKVYVYFYIIKMKQQKNKQIYLRGEFQFILIVIQ